MNAKNALQITNYFISTSQQTCAAENKMFINTCRYIMALRNIESTLQLHINSSGSILQKQGIKRIYDVELKAALHKQT